MPDTSYTGIQTPDGGDPYSFEQSLAALADSARVIIPVANATAAAQALTDAANAGFAATAARPLYVHRLDLDAVMRHNGSNWARITGKSGSLPYAMRVGQVSYDMNDTSARTYAVSFPAGRFTVAPSVIPGTTQYAKLVTTAEGISASGFTLRLTHLDSTPTSFSGTVSWQAIQMTDTSAEG